MTYSELPFIVDAPTRICVKRAPQARSLARYQRHRAKGELRRTAKLMIKVAR